MSNGCLLALFGRLSGASGTVVGGPSFPTWCQDGSEEGSAEFIHRLLTNIGDRLFLGSALCKEYGEVATTSVPNVHS